MSEQNQQKKKRGPRSPSYPYFDLETAAQKARELHEKENGVRPITREVAVQHLGYSPKSSKGARALSALNDYGLLDKLPGGKVQLTQRARAILHPGSPNREEELRGAALNPAQFLALFNEHGINLPSEATLKWELEDKGFNPNVIDDFVDSYRRSMEFGGVQSKPPASAESRDKMSPEGGLTEPDLSPLPEVGDRVQWESAGVLQFPEPRQVRAVDDSRDGETWIFVDGSETGIPLEETTVIEKVAAATEATPRKPPILPLSAAAPESEGLSLQIPFRGQVLTVTVSARGEQLRREHIKKVRDFLALAEEDLDSFDA